MAGKGSLVCSEVWLEIGALLRGIRVPFGSLGPVRGLLPCSSQRHKRTPQRHTYAPFFPVLQYNQEQQLFFGGNFWDSRATAPVCATYLYALEVMRA